jgi:cytochrome c-type biogenesis protein CcmE
MLATRRNRLIVLLIVATAAITLLAWRAAGSSLSYYVTPEEFAQQLDASGRQWRVGGRVVGESVVEVNGRPVSFEIVGEHGERMAIDYDGVVPNLFGPGAFVVVDGVTAEAGRLRASGVIIKHENEFFTEPPDPPESAAPAPATD